MPRSLALSDALDAADDGACGVMSGSYTSRLRPCAVNGAAQPATTLGDPRSGMGDRSRVPLTGRRVYTAVSRGVIQVHRSFRTYPLTPETAELNGLSVEVRCPKCSPSRRLEIAAKGVLARHWTADWEAIFRAKVLVCSRCRTVADGLRITRQGRDHPETLLTIVWPPYHG